MKQSHFDALVVGAGFGGIYQLHKFVKLGLNTKLIEMAADVGGTWYHNRYPGAMSDSYSMGMPLLERLRFGTVLIRCLYQSIATAGTRTTW